MLCGTVSRPRSFQDDGWALRPRRQGRSPPALAEMPDIPLKRSPTVSAEPASGTSQAQPSCPLCSQVTCSILPPEPAPEPASRNKTAGSAAETKVTLGAQPPAPSCRTFLPNSPSQPAREATCSLPRPRPGLEVCRGCPNSGLLLTAEERGGARTLGTRPRRAARVGRAGLRWDRGRAQRMLHGIRQRRAGAGGASETGDRVSRCRRRGRGHGRGAAGGRSFARACGPAPRAEGRGQRAGPRPEAWVLWTERGAGVSPPGRQPAGVRAGFAIRPGGAGAQLPCHKAVARGGLRYAAATHFQVAAKSDGRSAPDGHVAEALVAAPAADGLLLGPSPAGSGRKRSEGAGAGAHTLFLPAEVAFPDPSITQRRQEQAHAREGQSNPEGGGRLRPPRLGIREGKRWKPHASEPGSDSKPSAGGQSRFFDGARAGRGWVDHRAEARC